MIGAVGKWGLAEREEVFACYVHMVSSTQGEKNDGAFPGEPNHPRMVERLKAWSDFFGAQAGKLCYTGKHPENLRIAYRLGIHGPFLEVLQVMKHSLALAITTLVSLAMVL